MRKTDISGQIGKKSPVQKEVIFSWKGCRKTMKNVENVRITTN